MHSYRVDPDDSRVFIIVFYFTDGNYRVVKKIQSGEEDAIRLVNILNGGNGVR